MNDPKTDEQEAPVEVAPEAEWRTHPVFGWEKNDDAETAPAEDVDEPKVVDSKEPRRSVKPRTKKSPVKED